MYIRSLNAFSSSASYPKDGMRCGEHGSKCIPSFVHQRLCTSKFNLDTVHNTFELYLMVAFSSLN